MQATDLASACETWTYSQLHVRRGHDLIRVGNSEVSMSVKEEGMPGNDVHVHNCIFVTIDSHPRVDVSEISSSPLQNCPKKQKLN